MYWLKARFELYQFYACNLAATFPLTCFTVEHKGQGCLQFTILKVSCILYTGLLTYHNRAFTNLRDA